jgi:hypothetical protein
MIRTLLALLVVLPAFGQVRLNTLVVKPKEVYELKGTDILVVDTLILMDSATLVLNKRVAENFIHAKKLVLYPGSHIDGKGVHGINGRTGRPGASSSAPCSDGSIGLKGTEGTPGGNATSLFMSFQDIVIHGTFRIDISGGDGGDGGKGGIGGGGGTGTRICSGGNGGSGAPGSDGGNGGIAGKLTFQAKRIPELRSMLGDRILIRNYGGNPGRGGDGGGGGYAGLNAAGKSSLDGKPGRKGPRGKEGQPGKPGEIKFLDN